MKDLINRMTQRQAIKALESYPNHPDIATYGYIMVFDEGRQQWIGGNDTSWYLWNGKEFDQIMGLGSPWKGEIIYYSVVCTLAHKLEFDKKESMKLENTKIIKKFFRKFFRNEYLTEKDQEFKAFMKILDKKDKEN